MDWDQLIKKFKMPPEKRQRIARWTMRVSLLIGVSFVLASGVSDFIMSRLLSSTIVAYQKLARKPSTAVASISMPSANYRDISKAIRDRNLFNKDGTFPDESDPNAMSTGQETKASDFDINAKCNKSSLPLELVGTIYLSNKQSVATVKEKGFSAADIYKEGDLIIDHEDAQVVAIGPRRLILNNRGIKECLELVINTPGNRADGFPDLSPSTDTSATGIVTGEPVEENNSTENVVQLEEKYVQEQLGPGFGTIIQKARLVPNTTDNTMNGFKIFAIDKSSMLGKVGFQNGDIITRVNETSLKQPDQGFQLYQALQDEREVTIHVMRQGQPTTINIQIK